MTAPTKTAPLPAAALDRLLGDGELAKAFLDKVRTFDPDQAPPSLTDLTAELTAELGREHRHVVRRSLLRMASNDIITLDPPAMADWAIQAITGQSGGAPGGSPGGPAAIPLDKLHPNPWNPRKSVDPDALTALKISLLGAGQAQPILVRPHPEAVGQFQIVAGERRWRAASAALEAGEASSEFDPGAGLACTVRDLTDAQAKALTFAENAVRTDPASLDQCDAFAKARAQVVEEGGDVGAFMRQIADALGHKDTRGVQQMILVSTKLVELGRQAFADDRIKLAHARVIAGAHEEIQTTLINRFLSGDATYRTEAMLQKRRSELELLAETHVQANAAGRTPRSGDAPADAKPMEDRPEPVSIDQFDRTLDRPISQPNAHGVYAPQDIIIAKGDRPKTGVSIKLARGSDGNWRFALQTDLPNGWSTGPISHKTESYDTRKVAFEAAWLAACAWVRKQAAVWSAGGVSAQANRRALKRIWKELGRAEDELIFSQPSSTSKAAASASQPKTKPPAPTEIPPHLKAAQAASQGEAPAPQSLSSFQLLRALGRAVRDGAIRIECHAEGPLDIEGVKRAVALFETFAAHCQDGAQLGVPARVPDLLYTPKHPGEPWTYGGAALAHDDKSETDTEDAA